MKTAIGLSNDVNKTQVVSMVYSDHVSQTDISLATQCCPEAMVYFPGVYPILQLELLGFWAIPLMTESNGIGAAPPFHLRMETVPVSESLGCPIETLLLNYHIFFSYPVETIIELSYYLV